MLLKAKPAKIQMHSSSKFETKRQRFRGVVAWLGFSFILSSSGIEGDEEVKERVELGRIFY